MKQLASNVLSAARHNKVPLMVAGIWLCGIWLLVMLAELYAARPISLAAWAGDWDGGWYRSIVESGYYNSRPTEQVNAAFFPLFPLLVYAIVAITSLPPVWVGMAVASVCFAAALTVLYRLVTLRFGRSVANWTIFLLAVNPFSFYFGMMYTESLFLLLAALTFWFLYKQSWWLAALMAGFGSAARSVGVALGIVVIVAWMMRTVKGLGWRQIATGAGLAVLSCSGLILFTLYMWQHTGDPLAYMHAQQFWPGRGGLTNVFAELNYLITHTTINLEYVITLMWYLAAIIAFVGLLLVVRLRQLLMALYAAITLSLPIIFGTATSMNRYALVAFPIFIGYAHAMVRQRRWVQVALPALCLLGLVVAIFLINSPRHPFVG